jgi:hypothetical protein
MRDTFPFEEELDVDGVRGGAALVWGGAGAHPEIIKISPIPLFF